MNRTIHTRRQGKKTRKILTPINLRRLEPGESGFAARTWAAVDRLGESTDSYAVMAKCLCTALIMEVLTRKNIRYRTLKTVRHFGTSHPKEEMERILENKSSPETKAYAKTALSAMQSHAGLEAVRFYFAQMTETFGNFVKVAKEPS